MSVSYLSLVSSKKHLYVSGNLSNNCKLLRANAGGKIMHVTVAVSDSYDLLEYIAAHLVVAYFFYRSQEIHDESTSRLHRPPSGEKFS